MIAAFNMSRFPTLTPWRLHTAVVRRCLGRGPAVACARPKLLIGFMIVVSITYLGGAAVHSLPAAGAQPALCARLADPDAGHRHRSVDRNLLGPAVATAGFWGAVLDSPPSSARTAC
jgi:hypothetical protein